MQEIVFVLKEEERKLIQFRSKIHPSSTLLTLVCTLALPSGISSGENLCKILVLIEFVINEGCSNVFIEDTDIQYDV